MFLPIAMATTDALLNTLRIPGQIVVDDETTKLQVDPFCARFGSNHNGSPLPEFLNQGGAYTHTFRAGDHVLFGMALQPMAIDVQRIRIVIRAIQGDETPS